MNHSTINRSDTLVVTPLTDLNQAKPLLISGEISRIQLKNLKTLKKLHFLQLVQFVLSANVAVLDLSGLQLTSTHLMLIAKVWKNLLTKGVGNSFKELKIANNFIGIKKQLKLCQTLLSPLFKPDTEAFAMLLDNISKTQIVSLDLSRNFLNAAHCDLLYNWLRKNTRNFNLNLTHNYVCFNCSFPENFWHSGNYVFDRRPQMGVNSLDELLNYSTERRLFIEFLPTQTQVPTTDFNFIADEKDTERKKIISGLITQREKDIQKKLVQIQKKYEKHTREYDLRIQNTLEALDFLPTVIKTLIVESICQVSFFKKNPLSPGRNHLNEEKQTDQLKLGI